MTTEKLIELAKYCTRRNFNSYTSCKDCPYDNNVLCQDMLLLDVAERLEKAYADLKKCSCETCEYNDICEQGGDDIPICTDGNLWEWEGDSE